MTTLYHPAIAYYSDNARKFHQSYQVEANRLERVAFWRRLIARVIPHATLTYDIGCGSGVITCLLAGYSDNVTAIDGSADMLALAKQTAQLQGLGNITFEQRVLPVAEDFALADALICSSVVEYLDSPEEMLHFFSRILHAGGMAIWSVSNADSLSRCLVRCIYRITGYPSYIGLLKHFMAPDNIENLLARTGFALVEYAYCEQADILNRLLGIFLPARYASNMIIVVAKKL